MKKLNAVCDVCNRCVIRDCHRYIPFGCSSFKEALSLKATIFESALYKNPQGLHDTLKNLNMKIVDNNRKPYFSIIVNR